MTQFPNSVEVSKEDAFHFIVRLLRENFIPDLGSSYGYDVYLPNIVQHYLMSVAKRSHGEAQRDYRAASPPFLAAAWVRVSQILSAGGKEVRLVQNKF